MDTSQWADKLGTAITVCDTTGMIIYMNELSIGTFCKGCSTLVGRNLSEFHNERSWSIIQDLIANQTSNEYTIEKAGVHKLIKQSCWYKNDGTLGGLVEFSIVIPASMPHYVR